MSTTAQASGLPADSAERINPRRLIAFLAMCFGMFMAFLDIQIVSASLSEIQAGLAASQDEGGTGCAHPVKLGMLLRKVLDAFVGGREGSKQRYLRSIAEGLVIDVADRFDCQTAGF